MKTAPLLSRRKLWFFRGVLVSILIGGSCVLIEVALRWLGHRSQTGEVMDPGLMCHDPDLGWALTPRWSGLHRHPEYTVRYTIDETGFRSNGRPGAGMSAIEEGAIFVVGDSFTFGIGVGDADTFVAQLERNDPKRRRWINAGVPGYSTDQELLLIERRILPMRPRAVLLVLYLANDVFDNGRDVPLQASWNKPRFRAESGGLRLERLEEAAPERVRQTPSRAGHSLKVTVLGQERKAWPWWLRIFSSSALWQTLVERLPCDATEFGWEERFGSNLALTEILIEHARQSCLREGVRFSVVLLAGRSHALWPRSLSGAYQEYLRKELLLRAAMRQWEVVDVAGALEKRGRPELSRVYYAHDGHLTSEGHRIVSTVSGFARPSL